MYRLNHSADFYMVDQFVETAVLPNRTAYQREADKTRCFRSCLQADRSVGGLK